jgi:hypothetical protein
MRIPLLHPTEGALQRFADGESIDGERERVTRHLAGCAECRSQVSFSRDITAKAKKLDVPKAPAGVLDCVVAERARGDRMILPVSETPRPAFHVNAWISAAAVVLLGVGAAAVFHNRSAAPVTFGTTIFFPAVASASELDKTVGRAPPASFDGSRLAPINLTFERIWKSKSGVTTRTGQGTVRLEQGWLRGVEVLRLERMWKGSVNSDGTGQVQMEAETVMVARRDLRLIKRAVHVTPYGRYDRINIFQQFVSDRVDGRMTTEGGDSRGVGRPIVARLPEDMRPFISEAFAPILLKAVSLDSGWAGSLSLVGWAVVPRDVFYPVELKVIGSERLALPSGTFDCWKMTLRVTNKNYSYWVRKSDGVGVLSRDENRKATAGVRDMAFTREF